VLCPSFPPRFFVPEAAGGDAGIAVLQVGLQTRGFHKGPIDGINGPGTAKAVRRLQKRARITVDGVPGRRRGVKSLRWHPRQQAAEGQQG
jgi:peptidoglycan hydrolase-like protein with peptidoglycan-binding domain